MSAGSRSGVNWMRWNVAWIGGGQRADGQGFGQAGHAFEQDVAVGEQADQQPVHQLFLADDDAADFGAQSFDPAGRGLHLFVQRIAHSGVNLGRVGEGLKLSARKSDYFWERLAE